MISQRVRLAGLLAWDEAPRDALIDEKTNKERLRESARGLNQKTPGPQRQSGCFRPLGMTRWEILNNF